MKITDEILAQGKSRFGGWNGSQFRLLGLRINKLKPGWKNQLIGQEFPDSTIHQFLALKDSHLAKGKKQFKSTWTDTDGKWQLRFAANDLETGQDVFDKAVELLQDLPPDRLTDDFYRATDGV